MTGVLFLALVSLAGPASPDRSPLARAAPARHLYVPTGVAVAIQPEAGTERLSGLFQPARLSPVAADAKAVALLVRGSVRPSIRASACNL